MEIILKWLLFFNIAFYCIILLGLMLNVPVNSYGHVEPSVHLTTFFPGQA